ncbi:MAG: hypothetical protein ABJD68_05690 [Nakamurella sp.]
MVVDVAQPPIAEGAGRTGRKQGDDDVSDQVEGNGVDPAGEGFGEFGFVVQDADDVDAADDEVDIETGRGGSDAEQCDEVDEPDDDQKDAAVTGADESGSDGGAQGHHEDDRGVTEGNELSDGDGPLAVGDRAVLVGATRRLETNRRRSIHHALLTAAALGLPFAVVIPGRHEIYGQICGIDNTTCTLVAAPRSASPVSSEP